MTPKPPPPTRRFTIIMGQGFADSLPKALAEMKAHLVNVRRGPTLVEVDVWFNALTTPEQVQKQLWDRWPTVAVEVRRR